MRARVLTIITERPDIHIRELHHACPDAGRYDINSALNDLMRAGLIVRVSPAPARKRRPPSPTGIVRGQSLARLMAGR